MTIVSVMISILWILIIPAVAGAVFVLPKNGFAAKGMEGLARTSKAVELFLWSWLFGQLLLWTVFYCIAVLHIVKRDNYSLIVREFKLAAIAVTAVLVVAAIAMTVLKRSIFSGDFFAGSIKKAESEESKADKRFLGALWVIFFLILIIQTILQFRLAYMDADDSYYVAEALCSVSSDRMYWRNPYNGITAPMDYRHSLEPFPIWVAFLSSITGMHTAIIAHSILPTIFLPLTYGLYAIAGSRLLGDKKRYLPIFLVLMETLVLFGFYSNKTPEKFFVTRIRQGKSTLASIIIPMLILCLLLILEGAKGKGKRIDFRLFILMLLLNAAGCLCSTLASLLCALPIAIVAICAAFIYKKWWLPFVMAATCLPNVAVVLMYIVL